MEPIHFVLPLHPEDLVLEPSGEQFYVKNEENVESMTESQVNKLIDGLVQRLRKNQAVKVIENQQFDPLYSLLS